MGTHPNISEIRAVGAFAVAVIVLGYDGGNGHGHADKAVVVDADPDDVEPGEAALRRPPAAPISSTTFLEPIYRPDPILDGR